MRIRKNATRVFDGKKISSSSYLICQLNRPPWHDDSFFTQGYWDNDLPLHGTSTSNNASVPASHSLVSEECMDLSFECVSGRENGGGGNDGGIGAGDDSPVLLLTMGSSEPAPLDMVLPTRVSTVLPKKRGRPRKSTSGASTAGNNNNSNSNCKSNNKGSSNNNNKDDNPYQFYYYSGFGPSWSKRRGETKFNSTPQLDNCNGNDNAYNGSGNSNSDGNIMDDDENKDTLSKRGGNNNGHIIESFKSVIDAQRELDYIEDEEDEEEWYGGGRVRKPIKARSLKSLM